MSAAKGLAEATGAKAAAVSNLQAVAVYGTSEVRAPFLDARRGEIYGGLFDANCEPVSDETVGPFEEWRARLPEGAELICQAHEKIEVEATRCPRALAGAIALLAPRHWRDAGELDANYVRRSDAELNWTDR